jgi:uridine phosphorylase
VGTCGALVEDLALGELVIAREAICGDGTSRALGGGERTSADGALSDALALARPSARSGAVVSVDLFYDTEAPSALGGALAVEMEAATLFAIGAKEGVPVACMLAVTDTFEKTETHPPTRTRIEDHALLDAAEAMGRAAIAALSG